MKTRKRDTGIWLVAKDRKYLILTSALASTGIRRVNFPVPMNSLKIGDIAKLTTRYRNDLVPYSRIKYSYGAKKENLDHLLVTR
jgi:hypothetical protein